MLRHRPGPLALLAASAVLPGAVLETFGSSTVAVSGRGHFALVGVAALVAAFASIGLTAAGVRRRDGQTTLLGTAFSTMTAMLAVHGIATPGVLSARTASSPSRAACRCPSAPWSSRSPRCPPCATARRMAPLLALQAALAAAVLALGAAGLLWPALVPAVPASGSRAALVLMTVGLALFAMLANRAVRTFALTRRADDLARRRRLRVARASRRSRR